MKTFILVLVAAGGMTVLAGNANAVLTMPEREDVQAIAWSVEFLAFLAALVIAWFVWRLSKRDLKNRNQKRHNMTRD